MLKNRKITVTLASAALAAVAGTVIVSQTVPATGQSNRAKAPAKMEMTVGTVSLEMARAAIAAAIEKAEEMDVKMNIAVVDAGANLVAFERMDGAWLGSTDIAIKKAKTARFFDMTTGALGGNTQPGQSLYNIEVSNDGLISFPGGIPLTDADGNVIGAIGVSGSNVLNDDRVAQAGVDALSGE
jgi:uncharacterized protein GlcG (DUF336 family)